MYCERERKRKDRINHTGHYILVTSDRCDMDASDPKEHEDDCWEFLERNVDLCDFVVEHYKANPDVDIYVHEKVGVADSESDDEE